MRSKALLLICVLLTLTAALAVAWYNLELERRVVTGNRAFDVELIKSKIDSGALSGLEAEHYLKSEAIRDGD